VLLNGRRTEIALCLLYLAGALVLLALAFLTPMFYYIPDAALAAVIIMAVTDMINFSMIRHLWTINSMLLSLLFYKLYLVSRQQKQTK